MEEGEHGSSAAGPIAKAIIEQYITEQNELEGIVPVSYTHLTLPTSDLV